MNRVVNTTAEKFWYICGCIMLGAYYFAKIPVKKALVEAGEIEQLTAAEAFWYVMENICFGSGYLAKVVVKKAFAEVTHQPYSKNFPPSQYLPDTPR